MGGGSGLSQPVFEELLPLRQLASRQQQEQQQRWGTGSEETAEGAARGGEEEGASPRRTRPLDVASSDYGAALLHDMLQQLAKREAPNSAGSGEGGGGGRAERQGQSELQQSLQPAALLLVDRWEDLCTPLAHGTGSAASAPSSASAPQAARPLPVPLAHRVLATLKAGQYAVAPESLLLEQSSPCTSTRQNFHNLNKAATDCSHLKASTHSGDYGEEEEGDVDDDDASVGQQRNGAAAETGADSLESLQCDVCMQPALFEALGLGRNKSGGSSTSELQWQSPLPLGRGHGSAATAVRAAAEVRAVRKAFRRLRSPMSALAALPLQTLPSLCLGGATLRLPPPRLRDSTEKDLCGLARALLVGGEEEGRAALCEALRARVVIEGGQLPPNKKRGLGAEVLALTQALVQAPGAPGLSSVSASAAALSSEEVEEDGDYVLVPAAQLREELGFSPRNLRACATAAECSAGCR